MFDASIRLIVIVGAASALAACGGDGVSSTPPPIAGPPPPSPPPPSTPSAPPGPIGLDLYQSFAVLGVASEFSQGADGKLAGTMPERADVAFERRASDGTYIITLPNFRPGALYTVGYVGTHSNDGGWREVHESVNQLLDGESGRQDAIVYLGWPKGKLSPSGTLEYTGWGRWQDDSGIDSGAAPLRAGYFSYGIPTAANEIPVTGSATYEAEIRGYTDNTEYGGYLEHVGGNAQLRFDFGAGTLAGEMNPYVCPWDCYAVGTYNFVETVFGVGSLNFSGRFAVDGKTVPSWFEGSFNGPFAAELMARFQAPYKYTIDGTEYSGTMAGIWLGRQE